MRYPVYPFVAKILKNRYEIRADHSVIFVRHLKGPEMECLLDTSDLDFISDAQLRVTACWNPKSKTYYAIYSGPRPSKNVKGDKGFLHRFLMKPPSDMVVDHRDHNGLNDRRYNLRTVTYMENSMNRRGAPSHSSTGMRGVTFRKDLQKFYAIIKINKIPRHLGAFNTAEEAQEAFNHALETRTFPDHTPKGTIYFDKDRGKWSAQAKIEGKVKSLGRFALKEEAENALRVARNAIA